MNKSRAGTQYTTNRPSPSRRPGARNIPRTRNPPRGGGGDADGVGGGAGDRGDGGRGDAGNNNPPPHEFNFSLTPGTALTTAYDFSTRHGHKMYYMATKELRKENQYGCNPEELYLFMKDLQIRADEFGWTAPGGILSFAPDANRPDEIGNMLVDYSAYTLERVREYEATYIHTQTRRAQDDRMLYGCIINSLSSTGFVRITVHEAEYHVRGLPSGVCLLKVLIRESTF